MKSWTIKTDACTGTYETETLDEAAVIFAEEEGIKGVKDADSLKDKIEKMGGWCNFFEDEI